MEKIKVEVSWNGKNFGAAVGDNVPGAVVVTAKTYEELQNEVKASIDFHVEGMVEDGDDVPEWLKNGNYEIQWNLDTSALLKVYQEVTSLAVLSRVTGINQRQLSFYMNGKRKPRNTAMMKIRKGMKDIAYKCATLSAL